MQDKCLNEENINQNIVRMQYAVRGPIVQRAAELEQQLQGPEGQSLPFKSIVRCNIGDCHATGQMPITFLRQVCAGLVSKETCEANLPADVKLRIDRILASCPGCSVGSYSASTGVEVIRRDIAAFLTERDGISCDFNNIFLSSGASEAIKLVLSLMSTGGEGAGKAGFMVPIPQYPLYSASVAELNAFQMSYYLDESTHWGLQLSELERAYDEAKTLCIPKAIVVINPGNPTGQILSKDDMKMVIKFARKRKLVILSDEVYQFNIYQPDKHPWSSFKSVLMEMGPGYADVQELVSFMSASKGYMGECGFRGGFAELVNIDPKVQAQLYKCLTAKLCPTVVGQAMIGTVCNPPKPNEPSYELFMKEKNQVLSDLANKAKLTSETLNSLPGISCNPVTGAMYAFPRINLPEKAIQAAKSQGMEPDFMYCLELLNTKGICVVPGSGFGQIPGTYHFRITILPPVELMQTVMKDIKQFHHDFMQKYS
ncbi:glycerol-3-phosphate O-acyltransferase 2 [Cichlidogyrus casuarinus]|uniref:alanine transaminase n=1 Tax=Cichlidogyrus casuarinus TaxID=1844966 RepID=A0ABD2PSU2_9PLAT